MRILFLAIFSFLLSFYSYGQELGVRVGPTFSNVSGRDVENADFRIGFHSGIFTNLKISKITKAELGVSYNQLGFEDGDFSFRFDHININFLFKHYLKQKFFIGYGIQLSNLVNISSDNVNIEDTIFDDANPVTGFYLVGVGLNIIKRVEASFRYGRSIDDIVGDVRAQNQFFQVGVNFVVFDF